MRRPLVALSLLAVLAAGSPGAQPHEAADPEAVFEALWETYDLGYALFKARGVDWDALHRVYRPRVTQDTGADELFAVLSDLLGHLNDNHVMLISESPSRSFNAGYLGRFVNDRGLAAAQALLSQRPLPERYFTAPPRTTADGRFLYGWVAEGIGYLHFGGFEDPQASAADVDTVIASFAGARAIIVDVRCNRGGDDRVGRAIAGRFADRRRLYMVTRDRVGPEPEDFAPARYWHVEPGGSHPFTGPVVLLQNRFSVSAAENFALAMRVLPHVTVVGDFSAGCFADMNWQVLPNGWRCSYAHNRFDDYAGRCWEGIGVPPDIMVRGELAEGGVDRAFETALALHQAGGAAPQDEDASARAARISLSAALARDLGERGFDRARLAFLAAQRDLPGDAWFVDSGEMLELGQELLGVGRAEEGLAILELHAQTFPDFMRAHQALGSACLRHGRIERGLHAYDRALALNRGRHPLEVDALVSMTLQRAIARDGVSALEPAFAGLRRDHPAWIDEGRLNALGYELLAAGQVEEAIAALRLNVESYPEYANGYDSLAEAYLTHGDRALALANYERALALDPSNRNAAAVLARLRGQED